jgi:hypothetical protein
MNDLLEEIKKEATFCERWARSNYTWAHVIFGISVFASLASSVLIASDWVKDNKLLGSLLAGLPGVMLLVNNTCRFEERTKWFWKKTRKLQRLMRELRDKREPDPEKVSAELSDVNEELEAEWPAFGASPAQPKKPGIG